MKNDWLEKKYKVQLKKVGKKIGYQSKTKKYGHSTFQY